MFEDIMKTEEKNKYKDYTIKQRAQLGMDFLRSIDDDPNPNKLIEQLESVIIFIKTAEVVNGESG